MVACKCISSVVNGVEVLQQSKGCARLSFKVRGGLRACHSLDGRLAKHRSRLSHEQRRPLDINNTWSRTFKLADIGLLELFLVIKFKLRRPVSQVLMRINPTTTAHTFAETRVAMKGR